MLGTATTSIVLHWRRERFSVVNHVGITVRQGYSVLAEDPEGGTHYRDVYFGETVYRLPVDKYLIGISPFNAVRDHAAFVFSLILPDLRPASADPVEVATWGKGTGWHKNLHVLVEYGRNFISQQAKIDADFAASKKVKDDDGKYALQYPETNTHKVIKYLDKNTYETLPNGCKKYIGDALWADVLQICDIKGSSDNVLLVECRTGASGYEHVPSPGCSVSINVADKTELTYSFGYNYFNDVLDIHRKLLALIASFRREHDQIRQGEQ